MRNKYCWICRSPQTDEPCRKPDCVARSRQYEKDKHSRNKTLVFQHYGNRCERCGETEQSFFSIDHTEGGGYEHRKTIHNVYRWLIANNFPDNYRILCYNCNCATEPTPDRLITRLKVLTHYSPEGPRCACSGCPEHNSPNHKHLTIDHINGGGYQQRQGKSYDLTSRLMRAGYPDGYQVLCYNCNCSRHHRSDGRCPHELAAAVL